MKSGESQLTIHQRIVVKDPLLSPWWSHHEVKILPTEMVFKKNSVNTRFEVNHFSLPQIALSISLHEEFMR